MMLQLRLDGTVGPSGEPLPFRELLALLDAIGQAQSLRGAVDTVGLSYRALWGRVLAYETALGHGLVIKTKGHGTGLSPTGERLRSALRRAADELQPAIADAEARLAADLAVLFDTPARRFRLALSHDPLLVEAAQSRPGEFEVSVMGSEEALDRLRRGTVDAAGFHGGTETEPPVQAGSGEAGIEILPLFQREQGLMLAPGNPLGIGSLADLAATSARFVNRQPGSGTRAWFDRLLADAGLPANAIRGYGHEEFTHGAVAAVVASGGADAGMGVRAAAERLGLAFVPLGRETYFLATRTRPPALEDLIEIVRVRAATTSGYAPPPDRPAGGRPAQAARSRRVSPRQAAKASAGIGRPNR
jgi:molybdate transport repressor ModE-like protein